MAITYTERVDFLRVQIKLFTTNIAFYRSILIILQVLCLRFIEFCPYLLPLPSTLIKNKI